MASHLHAFIPQTLLSAVEQNPRGSFDVIIQGQRSQKTAGFVQKAFQDSSNSGYAVKANQLHRQFKAIDGASGSLSGWQILALGMSRNVTAILSNEPVKLTSVDLPVSNTEKANWSTGAAVDWTGQALSLQAPTIAIVDSGIDTSNTSAFGNRVLASVSLATTGPNSAGDGYGHGTFVASIAAGAIPGSAGTAPSANLVSVDVMDDQGMSTVSDVVAAADWILANKAQYNIKVANFSLSSTTVASLFFDPIDQAVEKLWLNGITVVTAAGNYAVDGAQSDVGFAPANDPFVITVGASDIHDTLNASDDTAAPWSAWGYTMDGFAKPEISAPGRYLIGSTQAGSTLTTERPGNVLGDGTTMQLSGTSFSAPQVSAAAALILAQHPSWTPDQVKGALMVSARGTSTSSLGALGVGELNVPLARMVETPPNPNAGLDAYVTTDANGNPVFDSAAWQTAASADPNWNAPASADAAWGSAAWGSAAWGSAAWGSAAWGSAAWGSAAWGSAAWGSAAWGSAAWGSAAWDLSAADGTVTNSPISQAEIDQAETDLGIVDPACDPTMNTCTAPTP